MILLKSKHNLMRGGIYIKRYVSVFLTFLIMSSILTISAYAVDTITAVKTAAKVKVDGVEKLFDAYNIGGSNYFKLRDIAFTLSGTSNQFEVQWDSSKNAINLITGKPYTAIGGEMTVSSNKMSGDAIHSTSKVYLNGEEIVLTAYNINGNNYFKLRDIGNELGFIVDWDDENKVIIIETTIKDEEIERAIALGIIPDEIQGRYNGAISFKQYSAMLTKVIEKLDSSRLKEWEKLITSASVSDKEMLREDGVLMISYAAVLMGVNRLNYEIDGNLGITQEEMDLQGNYLSWNYPFFSDWEKIVYPEWRSNYMWGGVQLCAQKSSMVSRNTIYPYDFEAKSMHLREPLIRQDAIKAALRFYESEHIIISADLAKTGTVSKQLKALAGDMPSVSSDSHPNWYGSSMAICDNYKTKGRIYSTKEDIAAIAGMGFNYLRLMLLYKDFAEDTKGTLTFYQDTLENIDRIVEWCAEYNIHLSIDMHELPGYLFTERNLMENSENYKKALLVWDVISSRYAEVPSSLLSYNLVNEPDSGYFTDESYAEFAKDMISVIRRNDKTGKLLVSDGMLGGDWSWPGACPSRPNELLESDIMQTIHLYPWHALNRAGYLSLENWPYEHAQAVNNYVNGETPFYIKGNFKAGTVVTLYIDNVYGINRGGSLTCMADGIKVKSFSLDDFEVGKDNCTSIDEDTAEFADGTTNRWMIEFAVPTNCKEISIGGASFTMDELLIKLPSNTVQTYGIPANSKENGFVYETGKYTTVYIHCATVWENKTSSITINPDGSYTVENEASADIFDYETLRAYIKKWSDWSKSTGTPIMCNEFGVPVSLSEKARIAYMRSVLELFKEYDISWGIYTNGVQCWTPIVTDAYVKQGYTILPADKSLKLSNGNWYDTAMLELFREFME